MDAYKLLIKVSAVKELERISRRDRERVSQRIRRLARDPRPSGCEKLAGDRKFRIRQGAYRVVYLVDDEAREVTIFKIGHRREVYR